MNLYGIYKRNTIDNVLEMNASLDETREYCHRRGLHYVTCADVSGYMNEGCSTVHLYNGKYGKGQFAQSPVSIAGDVQRNT